MSAPFDPETVTRLRAAAMTWDETRQDWIPDPAVWGQPAAPRTYRAEAIPDGKFWYISVPAIARVTQARSLAELEPMTRDLIATMEDVPPDSFALTVTIAFPAAADVKG